MKQVQVCVGFFLVVCITACPIMALEQQEQGYTRLLNISRAITLFGYKGPSVLHGIDFSVYGYHSIFQYSIAAQNFMMVTLGLTDSRELLLGALDLADREFSVITKFSVEDTKNVLNPNLSVGICFLDHYFSKERLRYVFLTYSRGSDIYLQIYRMKNEEPATFTQMGQTEIGGFDHTAASVKKILPKVLLADVNHDTFMDIVVWQRIFAQKADSENPSLPEYSLDHEDILVMFFDWETITFTAPVTMQTKSLGNDVFWRFLFPSYWDQDFFDWTESSSE